MLISRRRLVFTDSQMMFQCCMQDFRETLGLPSATLTGSGPADVTDNSPHLSQLGCPSTMFGSSISASPFPGPSLGLNAMRIYGCIIEYSSRKLSYPEDILNAFNGVLAAYKSHVERYVDHSWGIPLLNYHSDMQVGVVRSLFYGLSWHVSHSSVSESVPRPGRWPSWSWTSIMGAGIRYCLSTAEENAFVFQETLWARFSDRNRKKEAIWTCVQGALDLSQYYSAIEISTWLLRHGTLKYDEAEKVIKFEHPSLTQSEIARRMFVYLDVRVEERDEHVHVAAAYLGTTSPQHRNNSMFFLLLAKTDSGDYRRLGTMQLSIGHERLKGFHEAGKLTWLPGPESHYSFNAWEHETVTLV
jgi:hypothetical protein